MQTLKMLLVPVLAVPLVAGGCRRQETGTAGTTPDQPAAQGQPAPMAGEAGKVVLESLELGKRVTPDGTVSDASTTFRQGDPLIASLETEDISPGTTVQLKWLSPDGKALSVDDVPVPKDARVINLKAKDTSSWAPGTYRVDVAVGGASVGSKPFVITTASATAD